MYILYGGKLTRALLIEMVSGWRVARAGLL